MRLEQGDSDVVDGAATDGFSLQLSVMCMAVQHQIGTVTIDDLGETRRTEKSEYLGRFALNGSGNGE